MENVDVSHIPAISADIAKIAVKKTIAPSTIARQETLSEVAAMLLNLVDTWSGVQGDNNTFYHQLTSLIEHMKCGEVAFTTPQLCSTVTKHIVEKTIEGIYVRYVLISAERNLAQLFLEKDYDVVCNLETNLVICHSGGLHEHGHAISPMTIRAILANI